MPTGEHQPTVHHRRFRPHQLELAEGGKLSLKVDGSIEQTDVEGKSVAIWRTTDNDWAKYAVRFGLRPGSETTPPEGRREKAPFIR